MQGACIHIKARIRTNAMDPFRIQSNLQYYTCARRHMTGGRTWHADLDYRTKGTRNDIDNVLSIILAMSSTENPIDKPCNDLSIAHWNEHGTIYAISSDFEIEWQHNTWTNMMVKMTILRLLGSSDDKKKEKIGFRIRSTGRTDA